MLKVIIESGALKTPELIRKASLLSMLAGADFVKTSTGKIDVAATPEAAVVMCQAIKDYFDKTGRKVGFKAAGGVRSAEDAALYYTVVEEILGMAHDRPVPHRCLLGRQQPPLGHRRQRGEVLLTAGTSGNDMQQFLQRDCCFSYPEGGGNTGRLKYPGCTIVCISREQRQ